MCLCVCVCSRVVSSPSFHSPHSFPSLPLSLPSLSPSHLGFLLLIPHLSFSLSLTSPLHPPVFVTSPPSHSPTACSSLLLDLLPVSLIFSLSLSLPLPLSLSLSLCFVCAVRLSASRSTAFHLQSFATRVN